MTVYFLEPAANSALDEIYAYTLEQWGEAQAEKYLTAIFTCFDDLVNGRIEGRNVPDEFGIQAKFQRCEHHYIYWKKLKDGRFGIMAILHESRLQDARLLEAIIENDRM